MNIISQFNEIINNNFKSFLNKYFSRSNYWEKSSDFNNYLSFMNDLDECSANLFKDAIKAYFEYIDEIFFNSIYRKKFCESKGFYERKNFVTIFGEINFKRRYYYDSKTNERFFFTDLFLGLPKRKHFDPIVSADIVDKATTTSYSKAGKLVSEKIGKRINNFINISRATARNIALSFEPIEDNKFELKRIEKLFIMLDEKFIPSQFNNGKDFMTKAAVIFEDSVKEYKTKKKDNSKDRYKLIGVHTCASIDDNLLHDTLNYIYSKYDVDSIKEINFMGDCALWIKNFPKSSWFKFNKDTIVNFSMDGFHFSQALYLLTTQKCKEVYDALLEYSLKNDKLGFTILANQFKDLNPNRAATIEEKTNYILNNWDERQLYQSKSYLKCSMESHISHIFADLFTSRPKAYSKNGLTKLLKLRLLKINGYNLKDIYYKSFNNHHINYIDNYHIRTQDCNLNYHTNESIFEHEYTFKLRFYI